MIRVKLPSLRKTPYTIPAFLPPATQPKTAANEPIKPTLMDEAARRDAIVRKLFKECTFKEGDTVTCTDEASALIWGDDINVEKICDKYSQLGVSEKWPNSDNPMIVQAWSYKTNSRFHCTTNFLKKS